MSEWHAPAAWAKPSRWRMPASDLPQPGQPGEPAKGTDEFGLSLAVYERFPRPVRYYLAEAYRFLGLEFDRAPTDQRLAIGDRGSAGTVPEMVFFGMLLEAGFRPSPNGFLAKSARSFIFQSRVLGGRVPGGAVSDFVVFSSGRTIAVRIMSVFHDERNPFGSGGAKSEEDRRQAVKLRSAGYITSVVDVNRPDDGHPLEHGPLALMKEDLRRAVTG